MYLIFIMVLCGREYIFLIGSSITSTAYPNYDSPEFPFAQYHNRVIAFIMLEL